MTKLVLVLLFMTWLRQPAYGQRPDTPAAYLSRMQPIVESESLGSRLAQRLDSLQAACIPSRSYANVLFNRAIDVGFTQRRLEVSLNFYRFQVDLLCRNDTIFSRTIASQDDAQCAYRWYNQAVIGQFLRQRNQLYKAEKTANELLAELATPSTYAFNCGDGAPPTAEGVAIERLVAKHKTAPLLAMLTSFNCETQAFGVAGLQRLQQRGYRLSPATQELIAHVVNRNAELVTCSGCLSGLIEKIYPLH